LFIVNVDWFFISHRLPIAVAAIKEGYEVHIACNMTDKKLELEKHGIIVHPIPISRSGVGVFTELLIFTQIFFLMKRIRPNIVHCITIKPVLYGNIVARFLSIRTRISSISGLGYIFIASGLKAKLFRLLISILYKFSLSGSKAVIFQNKSDRDTLKSLGAINNIQEIFIRGSGVDLSLYSATKEPLGKTVVMLIGRLLIDKGVNEFATAARIIKSQRDDIRMVLVGDIDKENPKSITDLQINKWVTDNTLEHWGYRNNIPETIEKSNIVVLPSYREGLPKSLIEAAACGRAVITTDVPGCRDAIEPDKTGLLVPIQSVELLAKAIIKLADNKALRYQFAINGRKLAESAFDIKDVVAKHLEIYTQGNNK
jgi:glycosyltransferase involved in cell wall biosynthesis